MSFLSQWIYLLALSLWVGAIVFFSFFTTPTLFTQLPREIAGQVVTTLFPRYYALGYFAGGAMLLTTCYEAIRFRQMPWIRLVLVLIMLGSSVYAGTVIRPKTHDLKIQMKTVEEGTELGNQLKAQFDSLHRHAVILNVVVLVGGVFLLAFVALRLQ